MKLRMAAKVIRQMEEQREREKQEQEREQKQRDEATAEAVAAAQREETERRQRGAGNIRELASSNRCILRLTHSPIFLASADEGTLPWVMLMACSSAEI